MAVRRRWMGILMALCILVTVASLISLAVPAQAREAVAQPIYILQDQGGKVGLWDARTGELLCRYEIYTHLLPAADAEALQDGIDIYTDQQLVRLLEDYGG